MNKKSSSLKIDKIMIFYLSLAIIICAFAIIFMVDHFKEGREIMPLLYDIDTGEVFMFDNLLRSAEGKSVLIIFLSFEDFEENECQELSSMLRRLHSQYGGIIEFLTILKGSNDNIAEHNYKRLPNCWGVNINYNGNGLLWRRFIDLNGIVFKLYNVTKTPAFVTLDDKHQFVERIEGILSEQRLEVALIQVICSCAPTLGSSNTIRHE